MNENIVVYLSESAEFRSSALFPLNIALCSSWTHHFECPDKMLQKHSIKDESFPPPSSNGWMDEWRWTIAPQKCRATERKPCTTHPIGIYPLEILILLLLLWYSSCTTSIPSSVCVPREKEDPSSGYMHSKCNRGIFNWMVWILVSCLMVRVSIKWMESVVEQRLFSFCPTAISLKVCDKWTPQMAPISGPVIPPAPTNDKRPKI